MQSLSRLVVGKFSITSAGACPARTKYGRMLSCNAARAVAVSPDTRLRPVPPAKCRRTRSNAAEDSRSAINSRTKGRIMLFLVYQRFVSDRLAAMRRSIVSLFGLLICLALSRTAFAQIQGAGALDATSSTCHGLTCSWTATAPIHQHIAGYEFYLDPVSLEIGPSSLVVKRKVENELLRTTLKGHICQRHNYMCPRLCNVFCRNVERTLAQHRQLPRPRLRNVWRRFLRNQHDRTRLRSNSSHITSVQSRSNNIQAYRF